MSRRFSSIPIYNPSFLSSCFYVYFFSRIVVKYIIGCVKFIKYVTSFVNFLWVNMFSRWRVDFVRWEFVASNIATCLHSNIKSPSSVCFEFCFWSYHLRYPLLFLLFNYPSDIYDTNNLSYQSFPESLRLRTRLDLLHSIIWMFSRWTFRQGPSYVFRKIHITRTVQTRCGSFGLSDLFSFVFFLWFSLSIVPPFSIFITFRNVLSYNCPSWDREWDSLYPSLTCQNSSAPY